MLYGILPAVDVDYVTDDSTLQSVENLFLVSGFQQELGLLVGTPHGGNLHVCDILVRFIVRAAQQIEGRHLGFETARFADLFAVVLEGRKQHAISDFFHVGYALARCVGRRHAVDGLSFAQRVSLVARHVFAPFFLPSFLSLLFLRALSILQTLRFFLEGLAYFE